jgi:hypothetical protein
MQQNSLIALTDTQDPACLLCIQSFEIPKEDNAALRGRQRIQGGDHVLNELATRYDPLRGNVPPRPGWLRPLTVSGAARDETRRIDRCFVLLDVKPKFGERHASAIVPRAGACHIDQDTKDPALQSRAAFKSGQASDHRKPCLLDDFFSRTFVSNVGVCQTYHCAIVLADERAERSFIACLEPVHQRGIAHSSISSRLLAGAAEQFRCKNPDRSSQHLRATDQDIGTHNKGSLRQPYWLQAAMKFLN